jgi:2-methylisocitrate lyase-like PEP mutase family enzyme
MSTDRASLVHGFRELHRGPRAFVMANAWDPGSAKLLATQGFAALATTSGASAAAQGLRDGELGRDAALRLARELVQAVELPVSADLENGFAHDPAGVALTIRLAAATGLAGGSIEDASGDPDRPVYELGHAVERMAAAAEATRAVPGGFVLTGRCENFLRERPDLDDTIRRLQAYEKAGAEVLFAPGLPTLEAVRTVCASVGVPVNFMVGIPGKSFSVAELEAAGVKRISLATSLYRFAMRSVQAAAREILDHGSFGYLTKP